MKQLLFIIGFIVVLMMLGVANAEAQCAMCRATLENNVSNGEINMAARLNFGILYLFALPYLLIMTIAILWYKKSKKNKRLKEAADKRRSRISQVV